MFQIQQMLQHYIRHLSLLFYELHLLIRQIGQIPRKVLGRLEWQLPEARSRFSIDETQGACENRVASERYHWTLTEGMDLDLECLAEVCCTHRLGGFGSC